MTRTMPFLLLCALASGCASPPDASEEALPQPGATVALEGGEEDGPAFVTLEQNFEVFDTERRTVLLTFGEYSVEHIDGNTLSLAAVDGEARVNVHGDPVESRSTDRPGLAYVSVNAGEMAIRYRPRGNQTLHVPLRVAAAQPRSVYIAPKDLTVRIVAGPEIIYQRHPTEYRVYVKNLAPGTARNFWVVIWNSIAVTTSRKFLYLQVEPHGATELRNRCAGSWYVEPYSPINAERAIGCWVTELRGGKEIFYDVTVLPQIAPGATDWGMTFEQLGLAAAVDKTEAVIETDEANNRKDRTLTVGLQ